MNKHILIVVADSWQRDAVSRMTCQTIVSADVSEAASGAEVLDAVGRLDFDIVLLDDDLPDSDALQVIGEMRNRGFRGQVLMLMGGQDASVVAALMKAGAVDCLPKAGLDADVLESALQSALHLSQAKRERERSQAALSDSEERLRLALEGGGVGAWHWDLVTNSIEWSPVTKALFGLPSDADVDFELFFAMLHPDDREPTRIAIKRAMSERVDYSTDYRIVASDGKIRWVHAAGRFQYDAGGAPVRFDGITLDIFARKAGEEELQRRAEREHFLADLAGRARALDDPDDVIADALQSVGRFLGVSRCVFVDIDLEADACTAQPDYRADSTVASMAGIFPISAFGAAVVDAYGAGRTVVVDDVHADPEQVPEWSIAAYDALGIRAHIGVPVVHSSRLVSCIGAHSATPRHWEPEEMDLLQTVVERTWLTVEVTRQQRALARGVEELHARAERETLLNRIGQALLTATDAAITEGRAVAMLGEALGTDRCFLVSWDYARDRAVVFQDHRRTDLPSLSGEYGASDYAPAMNAIFASGTAVVEDALALPVDDTASIFMQSFGLRSMIAAPYYDSDNLLSTALWVAMVDESRSWTPEETSLVETVAAITRMAVESARVAERERNIAAQLQTALTPTVPPRVPGMALAKYYEAALDEARVGGDFYDVFEERSGRSVLALGDLSGKGLAAASQVATVRNMLRYAQFRARTLAAALTSLNTLLTEQRLLTGFCTLFVGAYDSADGTLTYVNCGQEPALLRRLEMGSVEELTPTGPVLGLFEDALFQERTVTLGRGDALAIFSDGLTEVGRTRKEMLGVTGIADLLKQAGFPSEIDNAAAMAEHLALQLISGVDAAAQGGTTRDDMCLLIGVVE